MVNWNAMALRAVLFIGGLFFVFVGLDLALGGILTADIRGERVEFFDAATFSEANYQAYLEQDNNIRFFGGLFAALGCVLMFTSTNIRKYARELRLIFFLTIMGGFARLTTVGIEGVDVSFLFNPDTRVSLALEFILIPILWIWMERLVHNEAPEQQTTPAVAAT